MGKSHPHTSSNQFWRNSRPLTPVSGNSTFPNRRPEAGNAKFQIPNSKQTPNSKFQTGIWETFPHSPLRQHEDTKARRHNSTKMREARPRLYLPGNTSVSNRYNPARMITVNVHMCWVLIFGSILAKKVYRIGNKRAYLLILLRCKQPSKIRFKFPESAFTPAAKYPWN